MLIMILIIAVLPRDLEPEGSRDSLGGSRVAGRGIARGHRGSSDETEDMHTLMDVTITTIGCLNNFQATSQTEDCIRQNERQGSCLDFPLCGLVELAFRVVDPRLH